MLEGAWTGTTEFHGEFDNTNNNEQLNVGEIRDNIAEGESKSDQFLWADCDYESDDGHVVASSINARRGTSPGGRTLPLSLLGTRAVSGSGPLGPAGAARVCRRPSLSGLSLHRFEPSARHIRLSPPYRSRPDLRGRSRGGVSGWTRAVAGWLVGRRGDDRSAGQTEESGAPLAPRSTRAEPAARAQGTGTQKCWCCSRRAPPSGSRTGGSCLTINIVHGSGATGLRTVNPIPRI